MTDVQSPMRIGLVGCGNISDIYLKNAPRFRDIVITAASDLNPDAAKRQAERYAVDALAVKDLLTSDDVDIVLNLTIPEAHAEVSLQALGAGKHVYSEKPLATTIADGVAITSAAKTRELRAGGAPDTVLGAGVQEARGLIDGGAIGKPLAGLRSRDVARHGALAPESRLLLPLGGWSGVRHGPVLSICAGHAPWAGGLDLGDRQDRLRGTDRDGSGVPGARAIDQGGDAY